jgi:hypothetical protein
VPLSKTRSRRVEPHGQPASARRPRVCLSVLSMSGWLRRGISAPELIQNEGFCP